MAQQEENAVNTVEEQHVPLPNNIGTSKKVTDHLANQRTFLAWIRTGLATITFGFVVERFGLLLRELGLKSSLTSSTSTHYSSIFGISLTLLGVITMLTPLINFLHIRRSIDAERCHPPAVFSDELTIIASLIGVLLAVYLLLTA